MYKNIALWLLFFTSFLSAQEEIKGKIVDENNQPLLGANVFWQNTATGTTSDIDGNFTLKKSNESDNLVVSYIGYKTKKITITSTDFLTISLEAVTNLEEVTVSKTKKSTEHSKYQVTNVQTMGQKELLKAACCNISESFSTNPSIDVNFSDAVTGNKQIKMLGLTSPYILIAEENIPSIRGASQAYGLSFVPGTWVESIQIGRAHV